MAKMQTSEQGFGQDTAQTKPDSAVAVHEPKDVQSDAALDDSDTLFMDDLADSPLGDILSADVDGAASTAPDTEVAVEEEVSAPVAESKQTYLKQEKTDRPYWYVVYTYAGYEKRVMENILKTAQNRDKEKTIIDAKVPETETIETKNGKRRHVTRKLYPGYVMVKMYLTDQSWNLVRNTRGVTGFVGPSSNPIPLSEREVRAMGIEDVRIDLDVDVGDNVIVTAGPFENFAGQVEGVDTEKQTVRVRITMFGREVPMDLDFVDVKKI